MQTKDCILLALGICIGILIGWLIWYGKPTTNSGTTSNTASTSAQIPVETIKYVKVYIHDVSGTVAASKAIIPIVPVSSSMKVKGEFFEADVRCEASGSVDATLYNNQVYNASGTTTILQTASWSEHGQTPQSSNIIIGGAITTQGNAGLHIGYKLFETPPFLGLPGIDWTAGIVILK